MRGALFNILGPEIDGARVLDLYAGTGALAIEALSRGAVQADLVESNREALRLIAENLRHTGLADRARVWPERVERTLPVLPTGYDVVLADPPYADPNLISLLTEVAAAHLVREQGFVAIEHSSRTTLPDAAGDLRLLKRRRHGDATLSLYRRESSQEPAEEKTR